MQDQNPTAVAEEPTTDTTAASQERETQEETTHTEAGKGREEEPEQQKADELGLDFIETDENGQHIIRRGSSVYKGTTAKEAMDNLLKGIEEKDATIAKFKAAGAIKAPKDLVQKRAEEVDEIPPPPPEGSFIRDYLKDKKLDPAKLNWSRKDWDNYQDEEGLRDRHVIEEQQQLNRLVLEAQKAYQEKELAWYRGDVLKRSEGAVRSLLVKIGVDNPDEFSTTYHEVLTELFKDGQIPEVGDIVVEMAARVQKTLTPKQESKLQQKVAAQLEEEKRRTKGIKAPGSGGEFNKESKKPVSIREAGQAAAKAIRAGRL